MERDDDPESTRPSEWVSAEEAGKVYDREAQTIIAWINSGRISKDDAWRGPKGGKRPRYLVNPEAVKREATRRQLARTSHGVSQANSADPALESALATIEEMRRDIVDLSKERDAQFAEAARLRSLNEHLVNASEDLLKAVGAANAQAATNN